MPHPDSSVPEVSFTDLGMPTHVDLVLPVLRAIDHLGGSARSAEITEQILETYPNSDTLLEYHYPGRPETTVFTDRIGWARSTAKSIGATDSPSRGVALLTDLGEHLAALKDDQAHEQIAELFKKRQRQRHRGSVVNSSKATSTSPHPDTMDSASSDSPDQAITDDTVDDDITREVNWKDQLLHRLHQLPPAGFEKFVIYLLRKYGLHLEHTGSTGDEGVDAIGTAPLSPVLSSRVAVQVKRYAPDGKPIGRETVALFQRDAQTKGAERAILVTLSRFTDAARKAATMTTPTVDLISGERLAELIKNDGESGVRLEPSLDAQWFTRFE